MWTDVNREPVDNAAESKTPCMRGNSMRENRETQVTPLLTLTESRQCGRGRSGKGKRRTPDMHVIGESDDFIVPAKRTNKTASAGMAGIL